MEIYTGDDYESMSEKCAADLLSYAKNLAAPVLCVASGDTPKVMYKQLISKIHQGNIDISNWYFVSLDEWAGMNGDDEGSCRYHLDKDLFEPLHVDTNKIIFFDGRAADLNNECTRVENCIKEIGGIHVAVLGIGINGHVGMNEPGTDATLRAHVSEIHEATSASGQKYFTQEKQLTHGLTLGITSLMDVKFLMLLANGKKKSAIIQKVLESQDATPFLPATLLLHHVKLAVYLDKEAGNSLDK